MELPKNDEQYFSLDRMSNSSLKHFKKSPAHFLWNKKNRAEPTAAMIFGSAFHCFALEQHVFKNRYCIVPMDAPKRPTSAQWNAKKPSPETIEACRWWTNFKNESSGKIELDPEDYFTIERMNDQLRKNRFAMELLNEPGEAEKPFLWTDELTGVEMKAKMDKVTHHFTVDLKTTINGEPNSFATTCFNDYLTQPSVYRDARKHEGMNKGDFYFIAIEKEAPFGISIHKCAQDFLERGWDSYQMILQDYAHWVEVGSPDVDYIWQSPKGFFTLNVPYWAK